MIEAIKSLGEYSLQKKTDKKPLNSIIEDPASNPSYKHVLIIKFSKSKDGYVFSGIKNEQYTKEKISKYLYRQGSSNGPDLSPTSRITDLEKTFPNKIISWFNTILTTDRFELSNEERVFFKALHECLVKNKEEILKELTIKKNEIFQKKEYGILTLLIKNNSSEGEKYIGDFQEFKNILLKNYTDGLFYKYDVISKGEKHICSICRKNCEEVYGFVSPYAFYNVDKPGFVSGGFLRENAWKNYPVCVNCAILLEEGKKYIDDFLEYRFYGVNYYLIPKLLQPKKSQEIFILFEDFKQETEKGSIKINVDSEHLFSATEKEIIFKLKDQKNFLNYNFLFYQKEQSAFRILLYIEDIFPSRLKKLFEKKSEVDKKSVFKEYEFKKGENHPLSFNFGHIREFFPKISDNNDKISYFLEITYDIFTAKKIAYPFLLHEIIMKIQDSFINMEKKGKKRYETKLLTLKGFQLLLYLKHLDLLKYFNSGDNEKMKKISKEIVNENTSNVNEKIERFFKEFPDFFNHPTRKAIFLEGALTQFLLNIQYQEKKATPFRSKLQGLKLDERKIKSLLPEIQNKLEEYGKNYYHVLEKEISEYLIQAGDKWTISNDEINFYFILGMNLCYRFKSDKDNIIQNEDILED